VNARSLAVVLAVGMAIGGCGNNLTLSHSETACITPAQTVTIKIETAPGTELSFHVQDDFGGDLSPRIPPLVTDSNGRATVTWESPARLSTTTLHFLLAAKKGDQRTNRDIHVVVGGNGRSC
jgi:hypothetical protein